MITNCDHLEQRKFAKSLHFAFFPILFEAPSLRLRLAAAPCGKPMAFRSPSPHSFLRLSLRKRTLKPSRKGSAFPHCAAAHPYFGEVDAADFDPSVDLYGGGGLVSSVEDLARFYRALVRGKVFHRAATLQIMLTVPPTNVDAPGGPYAMGIQRRNIAGNVCWGHAGFWGTSAYHCPDTDVTIVRHYNQAQPAPDFIFKPLYEQIANSLKIRKEN